MLKRSDSPYVPLLPNRAVLTFQINNAGNETFKSIRDKNDKKPVILYRSNSVYEKIIQSEQKLLQRKLKLLKKEKTDHIYLMNKEMQNVKNIQRRITTAGLFKNNQNNDLSNLTNFEAINSARMVEKKSVEVVKDNFALLNERKLTAKKNDKVLSRCKSSIINNVYEIKRLPERIPASKSNQGFTKTHLFDVYLDSDESPVKKEKLPSILQLYDSAYRLNLIQKYNPSTVKSFNQLIKESEQLKSTLKPKYDPKSNSLVFDRTRVCRMGENKNNGSKLMTSKFEVTTTNIGKDVIHQTPQ